MREKRVSTSKPVVSKCWLGTEAEALSQALG